MAVLAIPEDIGTRFAPYIRELHELFGMHGVSFGHPKDLHGFNVRLDAPGTFAEDVSSILRSIILREGGALPHAELLEILALAVSGREVDPAAAEMQPEFRKLLTFVGGVAGRPWNEPPKAEAIPAAGAAPERNMDRNTAPRPVIVRPVAAATANTATAGTAALKAIPEAAPRVTAATPVAVSPASSAAVEGAGAVHAPEPAARTTVQRPAIRFSGREDTEQESQSEPLPPLPTVPKSFPSSTPLWIGAVCALVLVIGVVFYSHTSLSRPGERVQDPESMTLPEPVRAPQPVPEVKPTPDVAPAPETKVKPTPTPPALVRTPAPVAGPPAHSAPPPKPVPPPVKAAPEPTPDAMLAAAAEPGDPAGEDEAAGARGPRAALRSPTATAGKGPYFLVSSGIMASHLVEAPPPAYPMMARLTHLQGQVILQAVISTDGQVIATRVLSGHRLLRGAAVSAVKHWRYRPYIMDGHPVNVATIITVEFHSHS